MPRTRTWPDLLVGHEMDVALGLTATAVGLFVLVFSLAGLGVDRSLALVSDFHYPLLFVLLALAALATYYNEGMLVVFLLTLAPIYAVAIHLAHVGNTGPNSYAEAVVMAIPIALVFAVPTALLGFVAGLTARRYTG